MKPLMWAGNFKEKLDYPKFDAFIADRWVVD